MYKNQNLIQMLRLILRVNKMETNQVVRNDYVIRKRGCIEMSS